MRQNPNTARFWDRKIGGVSRIPKGDWVTRDRLYSIISFIPDNEGELLDVGLGYGFLEDFLQRKRKKVKVIGIDLSSTAVKQARKFFDGHFLVGISQSLPIQDSTFDYVCLLEVLEHLYRKDAMHSLNEARRVLKLHGRLIVSVPLFDHVYHGHPSGHVRMYFPARLISELDRSGFRVIDRKFLYAFSNFYFIKNLVNGILKFRRPNNLIVVAEKKDRTDRTDKMVKKEKTDKKNEKDQGDKGNRGMKK